MNQSHHKDTPINGISILIPCAGRLPLLEKLLQSVKVARNNFQLPTEVLLIDNSQSNEQKTVQSLAELFDAKYYLGNNNISQKRNFGAMQARFNVILFLDSDCYVDINILREHYNEYSNPDTAGCLGLLNFVGKDTNTWKSVEQTGVLECFSIPVRQSSTSWGPTANFSFRRDIFLEVGGFDPRFSRPGGEDVDIGFKITDAGWRLSCNSRAIAYHTKETWASFWQVYDRFIRYGTADALLLKKHPARSIIDFPLNSQYAILLIIFASFWSTSVGTSSLLVPIFWATLSVLIYASIKWLSKNSKNNSWLVSFEELILLTSLDAGRLIGAIKYRERSALFKRIIFFEEQLEMDWSGVSLSSFASATALIITLFFFSLFLGL